MATKKLGKTRRFPIPPNKRHRDRKNDHQRKGKHPARGEIVFG